MRSHIISIQDNAHPGLGKSTVEVDVSIYQQLPGGQEKLLVHGTGIFKRLGALRAM